MVVLAGCTIARPRTDDPWEKWNRKAYAFNDFADRTVIRRVAVGYRKVTTPNMRRVVTNFFTNVRTPVTMANNLLQGEPRAFVRSTGRFLINTTIGLVGFFDPASQMGIKLQEQDFGTTLAKWGVPDGPYLVVPLLGSTTARDVFRFPVDRLADPLAMYARHQSGLRYHAEYMPTWLFLVSLRSRGIDAESLLEGVYDPYVFFRDAYRQQRIYQIYDGNPPVDVIEQLQGVDGDFDPEELLEEQRQFQQNGGGQSATHESTSSVDTTTSDDAATPRTGG
ncbi:VacJ family lipoprotein [Tahibacter amnicola]|uniref:VacJ family lipoprotein n=2 Tax=Tahibacter amnicola TaxID=2976241 RepID=A0ABY6BL56_9GAMM|nr:VacJ family lipoprotein [Tahibacter amnicola]UXI70758.1 VacJ family lipoprotein [Tahibacter amnicola]